MRNLKKSFSLLLRGSLLSASLAWFGPAALQADELKDCLIVHMQNGNKVSYVLEDTPVVTFEGDKLHVQAAAVSDDHILADVARFTFDKASGLGEIAAGDCRITVRNDLVVLEVLTPGSSAIIADMQGRLVASARIDDAGATSFSVAEFPAGVYVVSTTDGKTFKLYKK